MSYKCIVVVMVLVASGLCNAFAQNTPKQNAVDQISTEQNGSSKKRPNPEKK